MSEKKQGRPRNEEEMEFFSLRLRSDLLDEVRSYAKEADRSVTGILRRAIENGLPDAIRKDLLANAKGEQNDEDDESSKFILKLDSGAGDRI